MKRVIPALIFLMFLLSACSTPEPEIIDTGQPGSIQLVVFHDLNRNKVKDADEPGIVDRVALAFGGVSCPFSGPREELAVMETNPDGVALYSDLTPGKYCVHYMGSELTSTKLNHWVYLDSEELLEVHFGLTPVD